MRSASWRDCGRRNCGSCCHEFGHFFEMIAPEAYSLSWAAVRSLSSGGVWTFITFFVAQDNRPPPINVTISDAGNYNYVIDKTPSGGWLLTDSFDVLIKLDRRNVPTACDFVFLEDPDLLTHFVHPQPISIPAGVLSFRAKFDLVFSTPSSIQKLPFRVTCEGATSNVLSVDVKEKF
jgi:hypothetical protein